MLARPTNGGVEQSSTDTAALNLVADGDPELQLDRAHVCEAQVADDSILSCLGRDRHEALIVHVIECAVIKAVCIWCVTYEVSLLLRFLIALFVWYRQPKPEQLSLTGQG